MVKEHEAEMAAFQAKALSNEQLFAVSFGIV
jgi:hypothetical protein